MLVHLEPDAVPEAVEEAAVEHLARLLRELRRMAVLLEEVGGDLHQRAAVDAGLHGGDDAVERLLAEAVPLDELRRRLADEYVRVMSVKTPVARSRGKRSNTIGSPARIAPWPDSCPIAVCAPCETMNSSAYAPCSPKMRSTSVLIRSHVSGSPSSTSVPSALALRSIVARGVERGLARALRAAQALDLGRVLAPAPEVEELAVELHLDALRAQAVGELERKRRRHGRARDAEAPGTRACRSRARASPIGDPLGEQLVPAERRPAGSPRCRGPPR